MRYSTLPLAQTLTQLFLAKGLHHIVICPGSRNAPLTISFTENDAFQTYSIVDERCAAFFALGLAQQLDKPVAVVCTSGSAVLNFYPAVAEAYYSHVPLVILSADRPPHKIDIGDGQTIRQENVFANHIGYSANLKIETEAQTHNETEINQALNTASQQNTPVHINAPFEEPLYNMTTALSVKPAVLPLQAPRKPFEENLSEYAEKWNAAGKKMILVGTLHPNSIEEKIVEQLANDPSTLVLTETTSNLHHPNFIGCIDQLITNLSDDDFGQLQPEILLTFGGMVVSKRIKAFLRKHQPQEHWHIDSHTAPDTYFCLSRHFCTEPRNFLETFLPQTTQNTKSTYQSDWLVVKKTREAKHQKYLTDLPFSDLKTYDILLPKIPENTLLHMANSAAIRYVQLFPANPSIAVCCNRGTSGIDGSTSTAIGAAVAGQKPTTLITGDLSFFYDSNALWNDHIPETFRIIVINNSGGGIFRILPGHKNTSNFDTYFETTHQLTAKHLCEMFSLGYQTAQDETSLRQALQDFHKPTEHPQLLEVFTDRTLNDKILISYFENLR